MKTKTILCCLLLLFSVSILAEEKAPTIKDREALAFAALFQVLWEQGTEEWRSKYFHLKRFVALKERYDLVIRKKEGGGGFRDLGPTDPETIINSIREKMKTHQSEVLEILNAVAPSASAE